MIWPLVCSTLKNHQRYLQKLAKKEENPCLTCLKPISLWHIPNPKYRFRVLPYSCNKYLVYQYISLTVKLSIQFHLETLPTLLPTSSDFLQLSHHYYRRPANILESICCQNGEWHSDMVAFLSFDFRGSIWDRTIFES